MVVGAMVDKLHKLFVDKLRKLFVSLLLHKHKLAGNSVRLCCALLLPSNRLVFLSSELRSDH